MIEEIKKRLLDNPDKLIQLLEMYGFANIVNHNDNYISCGRDINSRKDAIALWLKENTYLNVKDFSRNIHKDIFGYIAEQKHTTFIDILNNAKNLLGIDPYTYYLTNKRLPFGGFYSGINTSIQEQIKIYDESELDKYELIANQRFLKDHIDISTQLKFGIRYDNESESILIPMRTPEGLLAGIKCRKNYEDQDMKYWYMLPCRASQMLYGFSNNYEYITNGRVYLFEAEKSVLQAHSYGINNALALGSGTISEKQVKLLYELQPKEIYLLHDYGYEKDSVQGNIDKIKNYTRFQDTKVYYWDYYNKKYTQKYSPTDLGKSEFLRIINEEVENI